MSEENVERVKAMYEAFNRDEFHVVENMAHPAIEVIRHGDVMIRGAEASRAWLEPDAFEAQTVEPLQFKVEGNSVVVLHRHKARGAASGIELEAESWLVFSFDDDGRLTRMESFEPGDQALEAVLKAARPHR